MQKYGKNLIRMTEKSGIFSKCSGKEILGKIKGERGENLSHS
jgi:hypothetical protein